MFSEVEPTRHLRPEARRRKPDRESRQEPTGKRRKLRNEDENHEKCGRWSSFGIQVQRGLRMNVDLAQELLNELGSSLQSLETEQAALLQFLKDNGVLTDDQFAPYLAQAGKASSVRWRAAHVRLEHLFSSERQKEEKLRETEKRQTGAGQAPIQNQDQEPEPKTKDGADSTTPAPWTAGAKINGTGDGSAKQAGSQKDDKQEQHEASEHKKPSPSKIA